MFSPSSIADFLACRHLTTLNCAYRAGHIKKPYFDDPGLELLKRLGLAHEERYLKLLTEERGLTIVRVPEDLSWSEGAACTIEAMKTGAQVIYQASFLTDEWYGRSDFLLRVEKESLLGGWSYEVIETKLARSTKARAIIQLCFYSDLLGEIQGALPTYMHVVLGGKAQPEKFAVQRYLAYFRKIRNDFLEAQNEAAETYPEPVEHCRICDWSTVCDAEWRKVDYLSLVANITRNQRTALTEYGTHTVADLARMAVPPVSKVEGIKDQAFANIHQQARLQVQGREERRNVYELLLPPEAEKGLCSLPAPSAGDVFLDFEGEQFMAEGGLEYLFGVVTLNRRDAELGDGPEQRDSNKRSQYHSAVAHGSAPNAVSVDDDRPMRYRAMVLTPLGGAEELVYEAAWAMSPSEEKRAFERIIGMVMERRRQYPDMHVYHYGAYEETAIKRMAGQHSTCVDEVDELLRGEVLVDLYRAVRQGLRASVESYSIKKLEPFYDYKRDVNLPDATRALQTFQAVLAFGPGEENLNELKNAIEGYNRDDCVSALRLREWLEELRQELQQQTGQELPRPAVKHAEPEVDLAEYLKRVREVESRLLEGLPENRDEWDDAEEARWLLAQLLEWHRREDKSAWWNYFRLCDLSDQELMEDKTALGGLVYAGEVGKVKKSIVHRYKFPLQDHAIDRAPDVHDPRTQKGVGEVVAIDQRNLTIDIKRGVASTVPYPTALIPYEIVGCKVMKESLLQLGSWVAENGVDGMGAFRAARDLLLRREPRLSREFVNPRQAGGDACGPSSEDRVVEGARRRVMGLDRSVLPIQGPPGSGKTYTGARMIVELVRAGKKVGVTAVSHKVISKLLSEVCKAAREEGEVFQIIQKCEDDGCNDGKVKQTKDNAEVVAALETGEARVAAGTVWLWSRDDMADSIDVLFVDEAGQMSLANVLAASKAAESVVLLGDPQQLDQPQRGVHPPGADASALSHILNGRATISEDRGLFLAESWRLHSEICRFTSEVFYDGRFEAREENSLQRLNTEGQLDGSGLRFIPVVHSGNQSESPEEVQRVVELIDQLLTSGATWTNKQGQVCMLTLEDILIVAPYNRQVSALLQKLPQGARVGTVDKFQGQEAPVVIYSMATSTPEDAPRGMEFLYSSNRLNVATSRAQCVTVLVASPVLFDVSCKTARQMELANAFCRYLEMARGT